jgi:hypothetical protein
VPETLPTELAKLIQFLEVDSEIKITKYSNRITVQTINNSKPNRYAYEWSTQLDTDPFFVAGELNTIFELTLENLPK